MPGIRLNIGECIGLLYSGHLAIRALHIDYLHRKIIFGCALISSAICRFNYLNFDFS